MENLETKSKSGYTLVELLTTGAIIGVLAAVGTLGYFGIRALNKYIHSPIVHVERVNVIGDNRAEKFIEFNGERFYSEVDGRKVEDYFSNRVELK